MKRIHDRSKQPVNKRGKAVTPTPGHLFVRVAAILEQARAGVVRAVNSHMVLAYWMIGREILREVQKGKDRAQYGRQAVATLSRQLTEKYGRGFSTTNLRYFRTFYSLYEDRVPEIRQIGSGELGPGVKKSTNEEVLDDLTLAVEAASHARGFSPLLG